MAYFVYIQRKKLLCTSGMQEKRRISYTAEHIQWCDLKSDCSHPLACSLPISLLYSFNSSFPPPSFFPPSPVFLFLYFFPPSSFLPCSISFFSPFPLPLPSFPWISFSLCFFPLPSSHPFLSSFPCISLSPSPPPDFYFPSISSSPSLLPFLCPLSSRFLDKKPA